MIFKILEALYLKEKVCKRDEGKVKEEILEAN